MTTKEEQTMVSLAYLVLFAPFCLWWTWTIKTLWLWLVVPTWKLDPITMGQAFALYLMGAVVTFKRTRVITPEANADADYRDTCHALATGAFAPLVWLFIGLVAKTFVA